MKSPGASSFTPIANPYIVGNPIEDRRMFFGREEDFEYIRNKITGERKGGLLVLCGTRRSGKTSILFQIKGGRLGDAFIPVLVDMQSITVQGDAAFLAVVEREICAALARRGLAMEPSRPGANPHAAFQDFVDRLESVLAGRKLVLMFDEYELFETHILKDRFSADVLNLLANWVEHRAGVFIVFTGSDKLEERSPVYWQHFLGKALHRRISFLTSADTTRLIEEPVRGQVTYAPGVTSSIWRLTAGQPFYTQVICQTLVDRLNEVRTRLVTPEILETVVREIIENPLPQMIFSWSSATAAERLTLSMIGELTREAPRAVRLAEIKAYPKAEGLPRRLDRKTLQESLERLFHADLLEKDESGAGFGFKMDLWRQWVGRMHSIWQVLDEVRDEPDVGGKRRWLLLAAGAAALVVVVALFLAWRAGLPGGKAGLGGALSATPVDSAWVSLTTTPPMAQAWLGELFLGNTPVQRRRVPAGRAPLRIERDGYLTHSDTLALAKDASEVREVALRPRTGGLRVQSDPPGATILVDGVESAFRTPHDFEALPVTAPVQLELRLAGFEPWRFPLAQVRADSVQTLRHAFGKAKYPLTVLSRPLGAAVVFDGAPRGATPLSLPAVESGSHTLQLTLAGYQPADLAVTVPADQNMVEAALQKLPPGQLVLQIEPYADVWIDGALKGRDMVNGRFEVEAGTHQLRLRNPSKTVDLEVTVGPGEVKVVQQSVR